MLRHSLPLALVACGSGLHVASPAWSERAHRSHPSTRSAPPLLNMPASVSPAFNTPLPPALDADAAALLEEVEGDVEKARASFIGYSLAYLEDEMPELYEALKTDPSRADAHAALVELTWDSIAAFMPMTHSSTPTAAAAMRMTAIARAALPADGTDAGDASPPARPASPIPRLPILSCTGGSDPGVSHRRVV